MESLQQHLAEAIATIIAGVIIALARTVQVKINQYLEVKTTKEQRETLDNIAHDAWAFAETVYREKKGQEKMAEAYRYFEHQANEAGIPITADMIRAKIEKYWFEKQGSGVLLESSAGCIQKNAGYEGTAS